MRGTILQADIILRSFWNGYQKYIDQKAKESNVDADEILRSLFPESVVPRRTWSDMKHKLLRKTTPAKILGVIQTDKFQNAFCTSFGLPQLLFSVSSEDDLTRLLAQLGIQPDRLAHDVQVPHHTVDNWPDQSAQLTRHEHDAIVILSSRLLSTRKPVFGWVAPIASGASWIATQLYSQNEIADAYRHIFHIWLERTDEIYQVQMDEVCRHLDIPSNDRDDYTKVARALMDTRSLIVFHRARDFGSKRGTPHNRLLVALVNLASRHTRASVLILTASRRMPDDVTVLSDVQTALQVPPDERFDLYREQFVRFQALRHDRTPLDPVNPRVKRAKWHYAEINRELPIYPATIKFRALFASNGANEAYHDATLGFNRLADLRSFDACEDVKSVHDDIVFFLNGLSRGDPKGRESQPLRFLRAVSTSLYWLNESALADFDDIAVWSSTKADLVGLSDLIKTVVNDGKEDRFVMSIGVKSIVQDHWKNSDPETRRAAHRIVAHRLYKRRDQVGDNEEFPMEARLEDNTVLYLAETIRHLIRSVEDPTKIPPESDAWYDFGWLDGNVDDWLKRELTDDAIVAACVDRLYEGRLMDGRERRLTRDHGAYFLRLEILQLLSADAGVGRPHPMMPQRFRHGYLSDLAFTLVDVGKVKDAEHVFRLNIGLLENGEADPVRIARALIDLAMVLAIQNRVDEAHHTLDRATELVGNSDDKTRSLMARIEARRAYLDYIEGHYDDAIAGFERLERVNARPTITSERAHAYIAALAAGADRASGDQDIIAPHPLLDRAVSVCSANLLYCAFTKRSHEALGFGISMAHLMRRQGQVVAAEAALDQVYMDIIRYGCSERTYLEFLREAGRTLLARGKPARAYFAYLDPCIQRAKSNQMPRIALSACNAAIECLKMVISDITAPSFDTTAWRSRIATELTTPDFLQKVARPNQRARELSLDPHYSFDIHGADGKLDTLCDEAAIRAELKQVEDFKRTIRTKQPTYRPNRLIEANVVP